MTSRNPTLYLCRHGETVANAQGRLQGRNDTPLTDLGREQAAIMGGILARHAANGTAAMPRFVCSPAGRARATMEIVLATLGLPQGGYETDARMVEIDSGDFSGLTEAEQQASDPEGFARYRADRWNTPIPGGESYAMVAARARDWFDGLSGDVVAVSHGGFGRILRGIYLGLSAADIVALDRPQDCVFRFAGGRIERLERNA